MLDVTMQHLNGATTRRFVSGGKVLASVTLASPYGEIRVIDSPDMAEAIADAINGVLARRAVIAAAEAAE